MEYIACVAGGFVSAAYGAGISVAGRDGGLIDVRATIVGAGESSNRFSYCNAAGPQNDEKGCIFMVEKVYKDNAGMIEETQGLVREIQGLKPRIAALLDTANACLEIGIEIDGRGVDYVPGVNDYEVGCFVATDGAHKLGFVKDWSYFGAGPNRITMLGINPGGMCGPYQLRTDGEAVLFVNKTSRLDTKDASLSVDVLRQFVQSFGEFEAAFYAHVDKALKERRQPLDSILADAGARSKASPAESGKGQEDRCTAEPCK